MRNGSLLVCMFRKLPSVWGGAANVSVSALGSLGHFPPVRRHPGTNSDVCSIGSEPIPVWVTDPTIIFRTSGGMQKKIPTV